MKAEEGRVPIVEIICLVVIFYVLTAYVAMPIILDETVLGRKESLDSAFDQPSGTPMPSQTVLVSTKDNITLSGWLFPVTDPKAWIIMLPDPHRNRSGLLPIIRWLTKSGYGVVAMDPRARGESGGKYMTGGLLEAQDLLTTIGQLKPQMRGQVPVVVFGISLSADAALIAASQSDAIDAVIADSPYLRLSDWMQHEGEQRGWMRLPGLYAVARLWAPVVTGKSEAGSNFDLTSMVKSIRVPVLFLKGEYDPLLTGNDLGALRSKILTTTKAAIFGNGSTNTLYTLNISAYQNAIRDFLLGVLPKAETPKDQEINKN
jgi:pimeloyl-ACP methyl ester carboxylesterase